MQDKTKKLSKKKHKNNHNHNLQIIDEPYFLLNKMSFQQNYQTLLNHFKSDSKP